MANTLFLRLEGPLQAWGERARWSVRDSAPEPTKSGVVGMLACALGWSEDDDLQTLSHAIKLGIRCDRPGVPLVDYHTVIGGVLSAEGKIKINAGSHEPETVVSWRSYLHDASFLAVIQAEPDLIARLSNAVRSPVWPVYLGRKSCPPAYPLYAGEGEFVDLEEALKFGLPEGSQVRAVIECSASMGVQRRDEVGVNSKRMFLSRYTRDILVTGQNQQEAA